MQRLLNKPEPVWSQNEQRWVRPWHGDKCPNCGKNGLDHFSMSELEQSWRRNECYACGWRSEESLYSL